MVICSESERNALLMFYTIRDILLCVEKSKQALSADMYIKSLKLNYFSTEG